MPFNITTTDTTLSIHVLNVGHGDTIIVELPKENNEQGYILIDCYKAQKTIDYLTALGANKLNLVVATHPHKDHILGLQRVMEHFPNKVEEFWDGGFRHVSTTWGHLFTHLQINPSIRFVRPTSGLYTTFHGVETTVLAPSISLRNRYDTYGVNINNASIVLKLEYTDREIILTGDAQWDSWAKITEEFPHYKKTENPDSKIQYGSSFNPLKCDILKVSHHGSKHGTALEYIERLDPNYAVISHSTRFNMPDNIAMESIREEVRDSRIARTITGTVVYTIDNQITCYQANDDPDHIPGNNAFQKC